MKGPYDDIIDWPYPVPGSRPRMPMQDRAAQFAPFAALTGFGALIRESERQTEAQPVLTDELAMALNETMRRLQELEGERPQILVRYFEADRSKPGGQTVSIEGRLRRLDPVARTLELIGGRTLSLDDIWAVEIVQPD